MRFYISLVALMWVPAVAQRACTICKGGVGITKPDGMVTTQEGQTASCEALTLHVAELTEDSCASLQQLAMEPCGCPSFEISTENTLAADITVVNAEPISTSESTQAELESANFVCSICGSGEMKNPSAFTLNHEGMPVSCQELYDTRESIAESECERVRSFAAAPCGCDGNAPATIDELLEDNAEVYTCSICGNGVIGNPNGLVINGRGQSKTCAELEAIKANIPPSMCPELQNTALEPCECDLSQSVKGEVAVNSSEEIEPEASNPTGSLEIEEVLSQCSICGDGEMTIPDGVVTTRQGTSARCDALEANPKEITSAACTNIQAMAKQPCGCTFDIQEPDTSILDDIVPFECKICDGGEMTIPDGIVVTPEGQAARCDALGENAKTVPEDICPEIQQLSNGPCGCTKSESTTVEGTAPWISQGTDGSGICHVCGGVARKVGNPANMVKTPTGMFTCYSIFSAGLDGAISMDDCGSVQTAVGEECGCYFDEDEPTPTPSESPFQCPVCGDGMFVTKPDGIIDIEDNVTCSQYLEEASRGRIDEEQCSVLQQVSGEACGCQYPPTFPTDAPTQYQCEVCGVGREIGLPEAIVMLPNYQKMSCATLQERAETGVIHYSQCARFQPIAQQYCNCIEKPYDASKVTPTSSYDCNICGPGLKVTKPEGIVVIPTQSDRTCLELMTTAAYGGIDENQCSLLHPFVQGPCGCEDPYSDESSEQTLISGADSPTSAMVNPESTEKRGDCFQDLNEIQALERGIKDTSITRMYVLCPGTTFDMGVWTEEGEIVNGQPFLALRPNVIYQCGHDGSRMDNCILKGGDFGLASYYEVYDGIRESVPGVEVRGLTFESQNMFSVVLKSAGDITFTGCAFKGSSNNVPILMQLEEQDDPISENRRLEEQEELKQVVTFQDCVFRDNFVDDSLSFPGIIENTFNSELIVKNCIFQDNVYGGNNNLASTGYAIRSFGPLTLESTCFIDNTFLNNGPVLVYGTQFSASDNYVESSQRDLTCELGALFSSQDDMADTSPTCESSDASVCAFTQGPTSSPTTTPIFTPPETGGPGSQSNHSTSSAPVTGRQGFVIGTIVLPMLLATCLYVFDF